MYITSSTMSNVYHLPKNLYLHQRQHSHQLRPLILVPDHGDHVPDLLGDLHGDLILHLVHSSTSW